MDANSSASGPRSRSTSRAMPAVMCADTAGNSGTMRPPADSSGYSEQRGHVRRIRHACQRRQRPTRWEAAQDVGGHVQAGLVQHAREERRDPSRRYEGQRFLYIEVLQGFSRSLGRQPRHRLAERHALHREQRLAAVRRVQLTQQRHCRVQVAVLDQADDPCPPPPSSSPPRTAFPQTAVPLASWWCLPYCSRMRVQASSRSW